MTEMTTNLSFVFLFVKNKKYVLENENQNHFCESAGFRRKYA